MNHRYSSSFQEQGKLNWLSLSKAHMPLIWKPSVVLNVFICTLEGGSIFFFSERWLCPREIVWERGVRSGHRNLTGQVFTSIPSVYAVTWLPPKGSWFFTRSPQLVVLFWETVEALNGGRNGLLRSALEILKSIPLLVYSLHSALIRCEESHPHPLMSRNPTMLSLLPWTVTPSNRDPKYASFPLIYYFL